MPNPNTAINYRPNKQPEAGTLVNLTKECGGGDNAAFLAEVARRLAAEPKSKDPEAPTIDATGIGCIGLLGEYGLIGYGIRRAQELVRADSAPSYWSHAFLLA